jgi:hypothetical protein
MAIINCPVCDNSVSNLARKCPTCGVRIKRKTNGLGYLVIGLIGVILLLYFYPYAPSLASIFETQKKSNITALDSAHINAFTTSDDMFGWTYRKGKDNLGAVTQNAVVMSTNDVDLDFPYRGGTVLVIQLRRQPKFGTDVILRVNKGQLLCQYHDCKAIVRFDESKPKVFEANKSDDYSDELIFIQDTAGFIEELKKSKKAIIEVQFYRNKKCSFEFNVDHLNFW